MLPRSRTPDAPYAFVVDDALVPARQWAQSPLDRTVGAERSVAPHAIGGNDVEGRTPFESQSRPLENLSVLRLMQEATHGKISMARLDTAAMKGMVAYQRAGVTSRHVVGGTSRCEDGTTVRARFAIAAVPFSVMRRISITPGLKRAQADAVARMPDGNQSQAWLRAHQSCWEKDGIEASMWTDGAFSRIRQQIESDGALELIRVSPVERPAPGRLRQRAPRRQSAAARPMPIA